jgi:hypothetical protein
MLNSFQVSEEKEGYEFILLQLLELAKLMDYGDEVGRRVMFELMSMI